MTGHERERQGTQPTGPASADLEAELRAGLEAEGGLGSVEPELAFARLFVHAHRVESLADDTAARIWTEIDGRIAPTPWWRRRWLAIAGPAAAAAALAAVLALVISPAPREREAGPIASSADLLEQQFELLAPRGRAEVTRTVEAGRGQLRGELLAMAMAEAERTHGGAP